MHATLTRRLVGVGRRVPPPSLAKSFASHVLAMSGSSPALGGTHDVCWAVNIHWSRAKDLFSKQRSPTSV